MKKGREEKARKLEEDIRSRGGRAFISPDMPEWMLDRFIKELDDCPDCQAERRRREH